MTGNQIPTRSGIVVLATFNEANSIQPVLAEISEAREVLKRSLITLSVLLVDDSSPDGTAEIAQTAADQLALPLTVLAGRSAGLGAAVFQGMEFALGQDPSLIITLDADGQHDARQIPDLVRANLARSSGVTIGSRWARGGSSPGTSRSRTALSLLGNFLVRHVAGLDGIRDATTSFRVIRPEVVTALLSSEIPTDGYSFFSAFIVLSQAAGFTIDEVPITFRPRYSGVSKLTRNDGVKFLKDLLVVRRMAKRKRQSSQRD